MSGQTSAATGDPVLDRMLKRGLPRERAGDAPRLSLINADAVANGLGESEVRAVRYEVESSWLRPEDLVIHSHPCGFVGTTPSWSTRRRRRTSPSSVPRRAARTPVRRGRPDPTTTTRARSDPTP